MTEKKIQINNIINNQLPSYIKEEFPLFEEFLTQYYISQEFQGASYDLIQNIDSYIKLDTITGSADSVILRDDIEFDTDTIFININESPSGTDGFPDKYGILKIDDEIITYTGKTSNSFTGCIRGFSGISSYRSSEEVDSLVFTQTNSSGHTEGTEIKNLSSLFLKEFLLKIKHQISPGFESREFQPNLNENLFLKQVKDFYSSKGTDRSFKILFKALYGENVEVIKPRDYLFRPSDSNYQITKDLIVESIEGNPEELTNSTLFQYESFGYEKTYASITKVEKITSKEGKVYYKLSIDANYDRNITVDGATYGQFKIHPQTRIIGNYNSLSTTIDVDSTIGFPSSGELYVQYSNNTAGVITYNSKSTTQFFDCSNITGTITDKSVVSVNTFASNFDQSIKVRITSVLKDVNLVDNTYYLKSGYISDIKTLGVNSKDHKTNNWFFNISPSYFITSISLVDNSDKTYRITTDVEHIFKIGDVLRIIGSDGVEKISSVVDVVSNKSLNIKGQGTLSLTDSYTIQRDILKVNSPSYPNTLNVGANVQNVYEDKNKILIASPSLPHYNNQQLNPSNKTVIFSGTFDSDTFKITSGVDHGFYTGDIVYYTPEKIEGSGVVDEFADDTAIITNEEILSSLFEEGIYYIKRIDSNTVKFALSKSDLFYSNFITLQTPTTVNSNKLEIYNFKGKTLNSQKLLRKIDSTINDGKNYQTEPGSTGILINGVEIVNYKSKDTVYYGPLTEINVISPGENYDVINPPVLSIDDVVGTGASAYCAVKGSLKELRVIDSGFDYEGTPVINITGGNGIGAKANAVMKTVDHSAIFNSESDSSQISLLNGTIGFTTYHKFRNTEKIIYITDGQRSIGGLSTNSTYYVSVQTPVSIKLHKTFDDALVGINTIQFTSFGKGNHSLKSFNKKLVLGSINIENSGSNYENKRRTLPSSISGINTSINQIKIVNHDYKSGEIIKYSTDGTEIGGLTNNTEYYVTVVDSDNFKLSQVGFGTFTKDFFYNTKQFIELTSFGSGIHTFNYPNISVEIIGNVGGSIPLKASVQPIFRGEITSVHLNSGGIGYGSSEILNYNRQPTITLLNGSGAQVTPIILDGKITEVLINSSGSGYTSPPDLKIFGSGAGAVLTPIIENGRLIKVNVIYSGTGYSQNNTLIKVTASGSFAKFSSKIQTWNVNLFQKLLPQITEDDGILVEGLNEQYGLQFGHLYAPRKLREVVYAKDQSGNVLYGKKDLRKISNKEINSTDHSPIIGWAYDGNPIYGPYGYVTKQGGITSQMKSGYKIDLKANRPPLTSFPEGFFVEDYTHFKVSDETVLDENNGRFCVTPEYPNGTYAYFATINDGPADSSGTFIGYKKPIFPYFVGNTFKSKPINFNFDQRSNQDEIDLNQTQWIRNTTPYNLISSKTTYNYVEIPNLLNQTVEIKYASPGSVESIEIVSGGSDYKVGDKLIFDNEGSEGYYADAEVETIFGKDVESISVASTTVFNMEFYPLNSQGKFLAFSENPHDFVNLDIVSISGFNTTSSKLEGPYEVNINPNALILASSIGNTSTTGIVTYFSVLGNLNYPNIRENDILIVGEEKVKVLNIDTASSRIRVLRSTNGTVGSSHSSSDILYEVPRKISFESASSSNTYQFKLNKEIYFNPVDSLGIGTTSGPGVGTTIIFSNPGVGITQIFIPTQTIYIPNHQLSTGDELVYSTNSGSPIGVSTNGISTSVTINDGSKLFVAKISDDLIGVSTFKVGLSTQNSFVGLTSTTSNYGLLYFTNIGSGKYHSFKTNYNTLIGNISKNTVTVSTAETHGLSTGDSVYIEVNPSIATTFIVKYNDYNRKLLINPKDFISSGINTVTSTITILNHGFKKGEKVVHTSNSPSIGLENNKEYYIFIVDDNNIRLSTTYFDATNDKPNIVGITSASSGTLSLVNPQINAYRNSSVVFDLSDSSLSYANQSNIYPAFDFVLFEDSNLTEEYNSNLENSIFDVQKIGTIGVTSTAKVILNVNEKTPDSLYYNLIPLYDGNLPDVKKFINVDTEVSSNNLIKIGSSLYNGFHNVVVGSSTSFNYKLVSTPEKNSYTRSESSIVYKTNSKNTSGSISSIRINSKGDNYYSLPQVLGTNSVEGTGAILEPYSTSIGVAKSTVIKDIGFNFPSDFTIKPNLAVPQILKIEPLSSLKSVEVLSSGRGYTSSPKLIVLDGETKKLIDDIDLQFNLTDNSVKILRNSFSLNNVEPVILPTQNSNGVGISSIRYESTTKEVTVTLSVGFSTANSFPFSVNDKVLIENVSVGVSSDAKGYNSENYDYQLFTITSVDENIGGFGSVTYSLDGLLIGSEVPGTFDLLNSSGRIIPEKYFPTFNTVLQKGSYLIGETVSSDSIEGRVEDWNPKTNQLKVVSNEIFESGSIIKGTSSTSQGLCGDVISFSAFVNLGADSRVENGWQNDTGFLNDNIQRVQDSFYYQNFSYSLKSRVDYDTWEDAVSTLNHPLGFKKFSDYQLESNIDSQSLSVILPPNQNIVDVTNDITEVVNLNCVYDYDLVRENALIVNGSTLSDEIIFTNRILTDYAESVGNRVLSIDDLSSQFNSYPRPTPYSEIHRFNLSDVRSQKYFTYLRDKTFTEQRQSLVVSGLIDNLGNSYLNQYARIDNSYDMGSFDLAVDGSEGVLRFYPTKSSVNDFEVTLIAYNLNDNFLGVGSTNFGNVIDIKSSSVVVSTGSTTIVGIATTYRSVKVLVSISANDGRYEFDELTLIHDGTNSYLSEYGQLTNHSFDYFSTTGLGTYYSYVTGSQVNLDFIPSVGVAATVNTIGILFGYDSTVGVGTHLMKHAKIEGRSTNIASSVSPSQTTIWEATDEYDFSYFIVQVSDITNNSHQISEILLMDDENDQYIVEYGIVSTSSSGIGTIGVTKISGSNNLTFTPEPNIDVNVKVYSNALRIEDDARDSIRFLNSEIQTNYGTYTGTDTDIKRSFYLTHKNTPIFERYFEGDKSSVVDISNDLVILPNHFFVTGELIRYNNGSIGSNNSIGIASTSFVGIGTTDKLPENVYVVKVDDNSIKFARTAEDALSYVPKTLNITSVGIGSTHIFTSTNQNAKSLIAIDNLIQSPVVSTAITTTLSDRVTTVDEIIYFTGITSFFGGDLIKVEDEIMRIEAIGIGSTNSIKVRRPWLGTVVAGYSTGTLVTKIEGDYNIVDNILNFVTAPYGNIPLSSTTNPPDERDWIGISTGSKFQGRTFIRSGIVDTAEETYSNNYIFNDISSQFNGVNKYFTLKSNGSNVSNIADKNAVILINNIFQCPGLTNDYTLSESVGITSIVFTGAATSVSYDVNNASIPRGGVIVSVGSTEGFGYQPLVSAGGTAIVSVAGTISSISIGNSGSGYRSGVQIVNVGVATSSTGTPNIEFIGTATVSNGHVVSVAITNPGTGYTTSNPPYVVFDAPLSYTNIPLIYSSGYSGLGTQAKIDIVVGQGSSVIDFEITNIGYGYGEDEILTVPVGGSTGIPTTGVSFKEFQISIQKTSRDKFTGWSIGELQVLDKLDFRFDGKRTSFPLTISNNAVSIRSSRGSKINVQDTLLVFINDILQEPGKGYIFEGGSIIQFTEAPKEGDTSKILFYRGSGSVDVVDVDILETVKIGDELTIGYDSSINQPPSLQENSRTVTSINSVDLVETNPYFGPGNTLDETLERPVKWCRQTEDKIINEQPIGKDRILYEPIINPTSYLIQPVGVGSTIVYVDNIRPFFNQINENNISLTFQKKVTFIPQESKIGATATSIVSAAGTISSIQIIDGGLGYSTNPSISIQNSIGIGTTSPINATANAYVTAGIVTSISITNAGLGYTSTNPPIILIEPPSFETETNDVTTYEGDFGIIVGINTSSSGIASTAIVLDLYIPQDSFLRNSSITGITTVSGIQTGYYFAVYDSNIGNPTTSLNLGGSLVGVGTTFIDNVYQVASVSIAQTSVTGVGITYVSRVTVSVQNYNSVIGITTSSFFGRYSWGRVILANRSKSNEYNSYTLNGVSGLSTGSILKRTNPLRFSNYIS